MLNKLSRFRKAIVALVGAVATWAMTYFPDQVNVKRIAGFVLAILTTGVVFQVPNDPPAGEGGDPGVSERGHLDLSTAGMCIVIALIVTVVVIALWDVPHG